MVRLDLNVKEVMLFKKALDAGIASGKLRKPDMADLQKLNLKISVNESLPANIPIGKFDAYKEFIRDGERLSNDQCITKYGVSIESFRIEVNIFVAEIEKGNTPVPRERIRKVSSDV